MKHIVHIVESTGGGVLKYLLQITKDLNEGKFKHSVIFSKREITPSNIEEMFHSDVSMVHLPMTREPNLKMDLKAIRFLYHFIKKERPDIVHLHSSKAGFLGRVASLFIRKVKVFYTPHSYSFLMNNQNVIKRFIYFIAEFVLSQVTGKIIACSKSEYRFAKFFSPYKKHYLLENAVQVEIPLNLVRKPGQIVGIGRLDEQKNPELFIKVISQIGKIYEGVQAYWIGDGPLRNRCEMLNNDLNAKIIFTGWLPQHEVINYLGSSRLFLQTSRWEGLPFTILEAFLLRTPVIATDITAHRDLIDGNNGFLAKSVGEFVEKALLITMNENVSSSISEEAMNTLYDRFNYDKFINNLKTIYNQ